MTDTGTQLLAAVCANPECDEPRLVYADWLQEQGEGERAEFVRLQCELARLEEDGDWGPPDDGHTCCDDPCPVCAVTERHLRLVARSRELLGTQVRDPRQPDGTLHCSLELAMRWPALRLIEMPGLRDYEFRRGFVEHVTCSAASWLSAADAIRAAHPVRKVTLTTPIELVSLRIGDDFIEWEFRGKPPHRVTRKVVTEVEMYAAVWPGVEFHVSHPHAVTASAHSSGSRGVGVALLASA